MKTRILLAIALYFSCVSAFCQATDPAKTLKDLNDYQTTQWEHSKKTTEELMSIDAQIQQKAEVAIQGVDIDKVDPKAALDWAKLFSMAKAYKGTCALAQRYLSSNPAAPDQFEARKLMMESCNSLGEGDMIESTLKGTKPTNDQQNEDFMEDSVYELSDTIADSKGPKAAYDALVNAENHLAPSTSKDPASDMGLHASFKAKEAEFLGRTGDKKGAERLLDKFEGSVPAKSPIRVELDAARMVVRDYMASAPALTVDKAFGEFTSLDSLKGKVVILDFFAHWCGPCKMSFPDEAKMYTELKDKGLEIIGVTKYYGYYARENRDKRDMSHDIEAGHMADFVKDHNLTWPVVIGPDSNFKEYGVTAIPHVVVIDRKGVVHEMEVGYDPDTFHVFRSKVEALLAP